MSIQPVHRIGNRGGRGRRSGRARLVRAAVSPIAEALEERQMLSIAETKTFLPLQSPGISTANDLILGLQPSDTDYQPTFEGGPISNLTNGTTQNLVNGSPDGNNNESSDAGNAVFDIGTGRTPPAGSEPSPWHATYTLDTQAHPLGYNLTEIDSITGHQDTRTDQTIDIQVLPVGADPATGWVDLATTKEDPSGATNAGQNNFSYRPGTGAGSGTLAITDTTGTVASNVGAVRFTALDDGAVFRELVVRGAPAPKTPDPSYSTFAGETTLSLNHSSASNGSASVTSSGALQLTDGSALQATSAFYNVGKVGVRKFDTTFAFRFTNPQADGFTFTLQNAAGGAATVGGTGGSLGYSGLNVDHSVAVAFDMFEASNPLVSRTALLADGNSAGGPAPTTGYMDLTSSGINFHPSGTTGTTDIFQAELSYDGANLTEAVTDLMTHAVFTHTYAVNIPQVVDGPVAYAGFTAGTGGQTAVQQIGSWSYTDLSANLPLPAPVVTVARQADQQVELSWTDAGQTNPGLSGYQVLRSSDGVNYSVVTTLPATQTTYLDPRPSGGFTDGASYSYEVVALGTGGAAGTGGPANSAPSAASSVTYHAIITAPPINKSNGFNGFVANDLIADGGFETPHLPPSSSPYDPTGGAWTFNGTSGLLNPPGGLGGASPPNGTQYAFLQNNGDDSHTSAAGQYIRQTLTVPTAGNYNFFDLDAQRPNFGSRAAYEVAIDWNPAAGTAPGVGGNGTLLTNHGPGTNTGTPTFAPASATAFNVEFSNAISLTAGSHTITLYALGPAGDDNTSYIDSAQLVQGSDVPKVPADLQFNGSALVTPNVPGHSGAPVTNANGDRLELTSNQGSQAGSAFTRFATDVGDGFTTTFDFQFTRPGADGFAFVIQEASPTALGNSGNSFGYSGIAGNSFAVYFNQYNNVTQTGAGFNGASAPALDMSISHAGAGAFGNAFHVTNASGQTDIFRVTLSYDDIARTLTENVLDVGEGNLFTYTYGSASNTVAAYATPVNLGSTLGDKYAYVGFTGGTGGVTSTQDVLDWVVQPNTAAPTVTSIGITDNPTAATVATGSQRSQVRGLVVTFAAPTASFSASQLALSLLNTGGSGVNDNSAPTALPNSVFGTPAPVAGSNNTQWVVPFVAFTANTSASGSLNDGVYALTLSGFSSSGTTSLTFYRLFGDTDGNKTVNALDYARFKTAFGTSTGQSGFNADLDFDNNGTINAADYAQFKTRFGRTFSYT